MKKYRCILEKNKIRETVEFEDVSISEIVPKLKEMGYDCHHPGWWIVSLKIVLKKYRFIFHLMKDESYAMITVEADDYQESVDKLRDLGIDPDRPPWWIVRVEKEDVR